MKAAGYGAWLNQYATLPDDKLAARARQCDFVIVKYGMWREFDLLKRAGIRLGVERYCYPGQAFTEGQMLAEGITRGAEFAVVNAEFEWEFNGADTPMRQLITEVRRQHPGAEIYGCTDTRSYRFGLPYTRVLLELATGMMPMIYAKEFQQTAPRAFASSLDGKDFGRPGGGAPVPVLPAIQTYNGAGAALVTAQVEEAAGPRWRLPGCQAYTIAHATDAEWAAFAAAAAAAKAQAGPAMPPAPAPEEEEEDVKPYLVREASSPFVFICAGVIISYLRRIEHATAMGIDPAVRVVPDGTLASFARLDALPFQYAELAAKVDAIKRKVGA